MPVSALTIRENIDKKTGYSYYISYLGDVQEGVNIEKELNKYVKDRKYLPTFRMVKSIYNYGDGPQVSYRDQTLEGDAELALQSFYPWLTTSIEDFAKEYIASSSPVMLFFGPTGTGKTTFIRTMAQRLNAVIVATADTKVATNPELFEAYKDIIEVARKTGDKRPIILLIEDVDSLLMSRISGNREMSKLLNDTKGISPNKDIKIIFTSNLTNPGVIDEALTRPGRCFAQINFDKLTVEQGNKVRVKASSITPGLVKLLVKIILISLLGEIPLVSLRSLLISRLPLMRDISKLSTSSMSKMIGRLSPVLRATSMMSL
jgi:energy-coupling factor transporter ATP-binding protein EcfA2